MKAGTAFLTSCYHSQPTLIPGPEHFLNLKYFSFVFSLILTHAIPSQRRPVHCPSSSQIDSALFCSFLFPSLLPSIVHHFSSHWMAKLRHNPMYKPALTEISIIKTVQIMDFILGNSSSAGGALVCCCADSTCNSDSTRTMVDEQGVP